MKQLLLFCAFVFLVHTGFANDPEENNGVIRGTVTTAEGGPAPEVTIQLKGMAKGAITDERGNFEIRKLAAGNYTVVASLQGFEGEEQTVQVANDQTVTINLQLKIGAKQLESVVVISNRKYRTGNVSPSLRLTTPILELSQNIQVISKGIISDQQSFDMLEGIQRNVSGAQKVEHWDNYARINMRGSQLTAFRNGLNVAMPWGPLAEDMSMVGRIEFVKGPAGFMLANGEPSGFYNVVTKKPSGYNKGEVSVSLGSFDLYRATADVDGKLSQNGKLLYRLNLMGQLKGSHRDFEYSNRYSVAPVLKYLVDGKTSVTLEYTHQYAQMNVIGSNYSFSKKGYGDLPRNFTTAEANLDPSVIKDNSLLAIFEHRFNDKWKFTTQGAYFHYNMQGQSLWPWGIAATNDSLMQRGISIWDALAMNKTGQMFLNGELTTGAVGHKVLAGLDMGNKDYYADWNQGATLGDSAFNIYNPVYGTVATADIPVWDRSKGVRERGVRYNNGYSAIYVQDELSFLQNKLRLTLAGRYTTNKDLNPYSGSTDDSRFTPRLGLSYSIDKNTAAYFVYDQAFLANYGADWQGRKFDPITGENLEIGIKRDWAGGKWNTALSAYQITKNNVLTTDLEHTNAAGQFVYSRQTGQQQTQGVEFDLKGQIAHNLELIVNYAFTEAKITKDSDAKTVGNQVPGATKHLQNTWASYRLGSGVLSGLKFSLGYQYQAGRSTWFIFDNSENALPDYFRLDGGVSYHGGQFGVNFNINNILDKYLYSGSPYAGMWYWQTEAGRNARITVSYKF